MPLSKVHPPGKYPVEFYNALKRLRAAPMGEWVLFDIVGSSTQGRHVMIKAKSWEHSLREYALYMPAVAELLQTHRMAFRQRKAREAGAVAVDFRFTYRLMSTAEAQLLALRVR